MPSLRTTSLAQLRKEIARREKGATKLQAKRDKLAKAMAALDAELADLGAASRGRPAAAAKGKRRRAKNDVTLPDALAAAIKAGKTVSPQQAAAAVKRTGHKSFGKAFNAQVAQALTKDKRFKRTGRGAYLRVGDRGPRKAAKGARKTTPRKTAPAKPVAAEAVVAQG